MLFATTRSNSVSWVFHLESRGALPALYRVARLLWANHAHAVSPSSQCRWPCCCLLAMPALLSLEALWMHSTITCFERMMFSPELRWGRMEHNVCAVANLSNLRTLEDTELLRRASPPTQDVNPGKRTGWKCMLRWQPLFLDRQLQPENLMLVLPA